MHNRLSRAEVPIEQTWNLDDLFVSEADWEAEFAAVDAARGGVIPYQGRLGDGAATLLACLDTVEALYQRFGRVASFAHLRNAQDGTHAPYQSAMARVAALAGARAALARVSGEKWRDRDPPGGSKTTQ